jgi:hypothetical protein
MSATMSDSDLRAALARIDRDLAESAKLREESNKFIAEQRKLIAEAQKLTWDRWLAPWLAIAALLAGLAGSGLAIANFIIRGVGHG